MKYDRYTYYARHDDLESVKVVKGSLEAESLGAAYADKKNDPENLEGYQMLNWIIVEAEKQRAQAD